MIDPIQVEWATRGSTQIGTLDDTADATAYVDIQLILDAMRVPILAATRDSAEYAYLASAHDATREPDSDGA